MERYTPLKFHYCFHYAIIPLNILACVLTLAEMSSYYMMHWVLGIYYFFYAAELIVLLLIFVGLFGWKPYAWRGIQTHVFLQCAFCVYDFLVGIQLNTVSLSIIPILVGVLIYIYYSRRRALFFPQGERA